MELINVNNYDELSEYAAECVVNTIKCNSNPVLGLATGSTPLGLYRRLIQDYENGKVDFNPVTTFNLDEYAGLCQNHPQSYYYFMKDNLFNYINLNPHSIHIPNGCAEDFIEECQRYEEALGQRGPIDLQILGLGQNGHIGFNEPGTSFGSQTHVVTLTEVTRQANARFFNTIDEVPTHAVTMGIKSIMKSKEILLLVSGEQKGHALHRLLDGKVSEDFPASILNKHSNVKVVVDYHVL